jgi:Fe-S-cluster containining protein
MKYWGTPWSVQGFEKRKYQERLQKRGDIRKIMNQLIKYEQCQHCRGCCKFESQDDAILFVDSEVEAIRQSGREMPEFSPYRNSRTVFRVKLKESRLDGSIYVCPFLNEDQYKCGIYEIRPFDCWAWPFLFARGKENGSTVIACFTEDCCPGLQELEKEDFAAYQEYVAAFLSTAKYLRLIRAHPALVWEDEGQSIFPISDVTSLIEAVKE